MPVIGSKVNDIIKVLNKALCMGIAACKEEGYQ
jgi:hypothetical protein